jgi:hypothetical protein
MIASLFTEYSSSPAEIMLFMCQELVPNPREIWIRNVIFRGGILHLHSDSVFLIRESPGLPT